MNRQTATQRGVITQYNYENETEKATCPFCQQVNTGGWLDVFLTAISTCSHFVGFVSAGGTSVSANFKGLSDSVASE